MSWPIPADSDHNTQLPEVEVDEEACSTSLSSSTLEYQYGNGRRYHGNRDGKYLGRNDEVEADRLDMIHEMLLVMMDTDAFPSAEVIGLDLSPIQPQFASPNTRYLVGDFEDEWLYEDQFDSIHGRHLVGGVGGFHRSMAQAYKHKKPGGRAEFQDWDANAYSEDGSTKDNISRVILFGHLFRFYQGRIHH
ncbi:hypothetical protein ETB97_002780 [Aspergillus alliaceus]|uniref:Uncharacterized protein n=1 Tax=Petromyces alliaceus TaxID=209559 RepID=A0A8H6A230_PETAA|nr:hypothetical protein ETB97_002780 [Aspergillus burnettii]